MSAAARVDKIRISMHRHVKNFRIVRKFAIQKAEKFLSRIGLIGKHGATHARKADAALEILVCEMRPCLLQKGQSFLAVPDWRKAHSPFSGGRGVWR